MEYNNSSNNIDLFANFDEKRHINNSQYSVAGGGIVFASEDNGDKRDKSDKTAFSSLDNLVAFAIRKAVEYDCFSFYRNAGFCIYCLNIAIKRCYRKSIKKKGVCIFFGACFIIICIRKSVSIFYKQYIYYHKLCELIRSRFVNYFFSVNVLLDKFMR